MNRQEFIRNYWVYYLILEEKFVQSTRYVAPVEENKNTYSLEYVNQLQTIGSEIDVFMKAICGFGREDRTRMTNYYPIIVDRMPDINTHRVKCYDFEFKPFEPWEQETPSQSLFWWQAYNDIKHGRVENFKEANMKATMYSLSALCLLELLYFKEMSENQDLPSRPCKESEIFMFPDIHYRYINMGNGLYGKIETS